VEWTAQRTDAKHLVDSPARRKIIELLTGGGSAVFLLLTSEDSNADDAAQELLRRESARWGEKIKLPEQTKDGPQLTSRIPLQVSFPVLVLSRQDPAEQLFVQMLLRGDEDLSNVKGPIVFTIFGRGRMLTSFQGDDLTARNLEQAARYLCGACSCQVKQQNPGVDLLLSADWSDLLAATDAVSPSGERGKSQPTPPELTLPPGPSPSAANGKSAVTGPPLCQTGWLWGAIGVAALLVLGSGIWLYRSLTKPPHPEV